MFFNTFKTFALAFCCWVLTSIPANAALSFPNINIGMQTANTPQDFTNGLQILIWLTILTLAPSILIMTTCFIRLVVVLSLTRQALGAGSLPPNQVITSLALILTFFIMAPTFNEINEKALQPYMNNQITQQAALDRGIEPIRNFMFKQTHEKELALFVRMAKIEKPKNKDDVPTYVKNNKTNYKFSGTRIKRGLYKTKDGVILNADVNGAYNIIRKAIQDQGLKCLIDISKINIKNIVSPQRIKVA